MSKVYVSEGAGNFRNEIKLKLRNQQKKSEKTRRENLSRTWRENLPRTWRKEYAPLDHKKVGAMS